MYIYIIHTHTHTHTHMYIYTYIYIINPKSGLLLDSVRRLLLGKPYRSY